METMNDIDLLIEESEKCIKNYYSEIGKIRNKVLDVTTDCLVAMVVDILTKHSFVIKFVIHQRSFWFSDESGERIIWDADIIHSPQNYPDLSKKLTSLVKFIHKNRHCSIFKENLVINKNGKI